MASVTKEKKLLGESLRKWRKAKGFTQEQLAEAADLNPKYIGEVERGEKTISVESLNRIAKALQIRVRKLVWEL